MDTLPAQAAFLRIRLSNNINSLVAAPDSERLRNDGEPSHQARKPAPSAALAALLMHYKCPVLGVPSRWLHCHRSLAHECWGTCAPQVMGLLSV